MRRKEKQLAAEPRMDTELQSVGFVGFVDQRESENGNT